MDKFVRRLDALIAWDLRAVDAAVEVLRQLNATGTPIVPNDTAIAGYAIAIECTPVTNNVPDFSQVTGLVYEDWV